jgi:thymidylate synthase (FAD)
MSPQVEIIASTKFKAVPKDLFPSVDEPGIIQIQDNGTDAERLIECAGRTCYDSYGKGRSSTEYHQHILQVGHGSVLEHASISFYISGISRGCSHELVRHRVGVAISQRSTRYVDESNSEWAWHPLIAGSEGVEELSDIKNHAEDLYLKIVGYVQAAMLGRGIDKATARKQARGAARGVLGNALETSLVWTANIRALRGCIEQRCSPFADAEIRLLFNRIYELALDWCPAYFSDYRKMECPDGIGYGLMTEFKKV